MARRTRGKEIDRLIDESASRLDTLPEAKLAERVQQMAASTGRWKITRVNNNWALLDENDHLHYADSSKRGYGVIDLTPARATMRFRVLGNEKVRTTGVSTERTFFVRAGAPGVHPA